MRSLKTIIAATSAGFLLLSSCGEKKQNSRSYSESGDAGMVSVIATHLPEGVDVQSVTVDPVANRASLVEAFGSAIPSSPPVGIITVDRKAGVDKNSNDVITVQINGLHYTFLVSAFEQFPSTVSVFNSGSATVAPALRLGDSGGSDWSCVKGICYAIEAGEKICGQAVTAFCKFDAAIGVILSKVSGTTCGPPGWSSNAKFCEDERERTKRIEERKVPGELKPPTGPTGETGATGQTGPTGRSDPSGGSPAAGSAPEVGGTPVGGSTPAGGSSPAGGSTPTGGATGVDSTNSLPEKGEDDPNCTCQCSIRQTVGAEPDCFWASLTGSGATGGCKKTGRCSQSDQFSLKPENTPPPPSTPNGGSESSEGCECQIYVFAGSIPGCSFKQKEALGKGGSSAIPKCNSVGKRCDCPGSSSAATSGGDNAAGTTSLGKPKDPSDTGSGSGETAGGAGKNSSDKGPVAGDSCECGGKNCTWQEVAAGDLMCVGPGIIPGPITGGGNGFPNDTPHMYGPDLQQTPLPVPQ